jgi:hypothetical protein
MLPTGKWCKYFARDGRCRAGDACPLPHVAGHLIESGAVFDAYGQHVDRLSRFDGKARGGRDRGGGGGGRGGRGRGRGGGGRGGGRGGGGGGGDDADGAWETPVNAAVAWKTAPAKGGKGKAAAAAAAANGSAASSSFSSESKAAAAGSTDSKSKSSSAGAAGSMNPVQRWALEVMDAVISIPREISIIIVTYGIEYGTYQRRRAAHSSLSARY